LVSAKFPFSILLLSNIDAAKLKAIEENEEYFPTKNSSISHPH
jgi:hypothetical protein